MAKKCSPQPSQAEVLSAINELVVEAQALRDAVKSCDPSGERAALLDKLRDVSEAHEVLRESMARATGLLREMVPNWMWEWP